MPVSAPAWIMVAACDERGNLYTQLSYTQLSYKIGLAI